MEEFWRRKGWTVVHKKVRPGREQEFVPVSLPLSLLTLRYINESFPNGLYRHQVLGLESILEGRPTCLATGTASGKSAVFYAAALESLLRDRDNKILALYPMKALGCEQEERWKAAFQKVGFPTELVCRIDGDVPVDIRRSLLRSSNVVIATPDVCHSWLLPSLSEREIWGFIRNLSLIVVDEIHVYTGVFGSNSAFLFRRLEHAMSLCGCKPLYLTASATIREPREHLSLLFGKEFTVIGPENDTSPRFPLDIIMLRPSFAGDILTEISEFLEYLVKNTDNKRFIAFVDSRKQTELISSIAVRGRTGILPVQEEQDGEVEQDVKEPYESHSFDILRKLEILPFRAGYEGSDREVIRQRLSNGTLRGIVSTSALELGMDIPNLDIAVLVGVPRSMTSLAQRIGRVGRQASGTVVIISNGDPHTEAIFTEPETLFNRPLAESALYLENPRIQYIHAMCLGRQGGEHDTACDVAGLSSDTPIEISGIRWPTGFLELCRKERTGQIPRELQGMKMEAGDTPYHVYPLRDVESQFQVELRGPDLIRLGSLSFSQVMREAYPGAVYYYTTIPYRVTAVYPQSKTVVVKRERRYTTKPILRPIQVFPNFTEEVFAAKRFGDLVMVDCHLQVRETVCGVQERRGSKTEQYPYPLSYSNSIIGIRFDRPYFVRNYFSTGVILCHPSLQKAGVDRTALADALYECFLIEVPFERQDIRVACGTVRVEWGPIANGTPFISIYDQVYGSLRLSSRLLDKEVIEKVIIRLVNMSERDNVLKLNDLTLQCAREILESLEKGTPESIAAGTGLPPTTAPVEESSRVRVLCPGSIGVDIMRNNEEFRVEAIFYSPKSGLQYRGRLSSTTNPDVVDIIPISNIKPIPGESMGIYDLETGELTPDVLS